MAHEDEQLLSVQATPLTRISQVLNIYEIFDELHTINVHPEFHRQLDIVVSSSSCLIACASCCSDDQLNRPSSD